MEAPPAPDATPVALPAAPSPADAQPRGTNGRGKPSRRARREQRVAAKAAAAESAAAVPAEAAVAEAEAPPPPHVVVELGSAGDAAVEPHRPLAPPLTERTDASRSDVADRADSDVSFSNAAASWPMPVRGAAIATTQLLVWLTQLWAVVAGLVLVAPLAALHAALPAVFAAPLAVARGVAQRPLLLLSVAVAAPLYLRECSWGIDFDALPGPQRPASMTELGRVLKGGSIRRWGAKVRQARASMEAAGVSARFVRADSFSPGVAHRRVLLAHVRARNDSAIARAVWLATGVAALHSLHGDCVEFRDNATGALQAFSLSVTQGGYCAGALYACRPEMSRAGIWATNAAVIMEQLVAEDGALRRVRLFDVGPTFGALKGNLGMHPLPWRRTMAVAAFSRALR